MFHSIFELFIAECNYKKLENLKNQKKNEFSMNFDEVTEEI